MWCNLAEQENTKHDNEPNTAPSGALQLLQPASTVKERLRQQDPNTRPTLSSASTAALPFRWYSGSFTSGRLKHGVLCTCAPCGATPKQCNNAVAGRQHASR
jgi:hypothetical protein